MASGQNWDCKLFWISSPAPEGFSSILPVVAHFAPPPSGDRRSSILLLATKDLRLGLCLIITLGDLTARLPAVAAVAGTLRCLEIETISALESIPGQSSASNVLRVVASFPGAVHLKTASNSSTALNTGLFKTQTTKLLISDILDKMVEGFTSGRRKKHTEEPPVQTKRPKSPSQSPTNVENTAERSWSRRNSLNGRERCQPFGTNTELSGQRLGDTAQ
ncbi:hypothetical protein B0H16DRAFT_1452595 [Mycena metata]|uniref:Uncharacterized protein n=1 Tax=Mycena metata TaxID=1033252 RepID=A0AAD7JTU0_9AGAR|nr:hypothetical protein B0H16DRAFT_1452595 [Mycena metata]